MPLDSNGIWIYQESDSASPFSDTLNLLADSTSDAIEDVNDRVDTLIPVTPWTNLALSTTSSTANFKLYGAGGDGPVRYSRWGRMVQVHGVVSPNTAAAVTAVNGSSWSDPNRIAVLPVGARPASTMTMVMANSGTGTWVINVTANGDMYANRSSVTASTSSWLPFDFCFLAN